MIIFPDGISVDTQKESTMKKQCIAVFIFFFLFSISSISAFSNGLNFKDVTEQHWANENISILVEDGIISGYPDGNFKPEGTITYGEFIKLAVIAVTCNDPGSAYSCHWATNYYYTALQAELFEESDISQSMFDDPIPRSDMALIASNASNQSVRKEEEDIVHSYILDIEKAGDKEDVVVKAYLLGIISGYTDQTFRPEAHLTRAEAATVILRIVDPSKRSVVDVGALKDTWEEQLFTLTNQYRDSAGLPILIYNENLASVAKLKAEDLCDHAYFDHVSPTYGSPFDMLKAFDIHFTAAGENIAKGYDTPTKAMNAFINSSCHKEIILHPAFTEMGIGCTKGTDGYVYWVQLFIHP